MTHIRYVGKVAARAAPTPHRAPVRRRRRARKGVVACGRRLTLMCGCTRDEGFVALRRCPAWGGVKPPQGALAEDCRAERWGERRRVSRHGYTPGCSSVQWKDWPKVTSLYGPGAFRRGMDAKVGTPVEKDLALLALLLWAGRAAIAPPLGP